MKPQERVAQLLSQPGNFECADCHSPNPTWASATFGVFICLHCSGVHRNLGTHITLVRSVELDKWTDEQATTMEHVGNTVGNRFWEARLPKGFARPGPHDHARLEKFIRDKYVVKLWAGSGNPPHQLKLPTRACSIATLAKSPGKPKEVAVGKSLRFARPIATDGEKKPENGVVVSRKLVYGQSEPKERAGKAEASENEVEASPANRMPKFAKRIVEKQEVKATPVKVVEKGNPAPPKAKKVTENLPTAAEICAQQKEPKKSRFAKQKREDGAVEPNAAAVQSKKDAKMIMGFIEHYKA